MKLSVILCLAVCMQVSAGSFGQVISLNVKDGPLNKVLNNVQRQSGYGIFYDAKMLRTAKPVTVYLNKVTLTTALDECFKEQPFTYIIKEKTIVVTPKAAPVTAPADAIVVSGTIMDNKGQPLPGVTVKIKETNNGTVSDNNGRYSIRIPDNSSVLVFSFVGFSQQQIKVNGKTQINITLIEQSADLNPVVMVGYASQRKTDVISSIATLQSKDIENPAVSNPLQSLEGKIPGLQVSQTSGQPGSEGLNLLIRGPNSFASNNSPLVLINGVVGDINELDPSFIESISVLKDASSAAIYGARASNGVILITTKTGNNASGFTVTLNSNYINQSKTNWPDRVWNSVEYMNMRNTAITNAANGNTKYDQSTIDLYKNPSTEYPSFNWEDYMIRPIDIFNNTLSIGGKSGNTNYQAGVGIWNQNGIVRGFDYKKYTGMFSIESQVNKRLKIGITFHGAQLQQKEPSNGTQDEILSTLAQQPDYKPYLSDGSGNYTRRAWPYEYPQKNPAALANEGGQWVNEFNFNGTAYAQLRILSGLTWEVRGGMTNETADIKWQSVAIPVYNYITNQPDGYANDQSTIKLSETNTIYKYYTGFTTLNYKRSVFNDLNIDALVGTSREKNVTTNLSGYRYGFASPSLDVLSAGPTDGQTNSGSESEYALQSFFGRLDLNYKHKYLVEANFRRDGSSRFPPDYKYAFFPSFSAGWHADQEAFIQHNLPWLNEFKLRASYGKLGNDNINGNYPYQATLTTSASYPFSSLQGGVGLNNLANNKLKWEETSVKNIGLDFNVSNSRLYGSIDYFIKNTSGILRQEQIPGYSGVGSPYVNEGVVQNKGFEILVGNKTKIGQVTFGGSFNISAYKNKVIKFGAPEYGGTKMMKEGYEMNRYYMYESDGIYQSQAEIDKGATTPWMQSPGDVRIKDVNKDGAITPDDRVDVSGAFASCYYGLNLFANYKGFSFSIFFQGVQGTKVLLNGEYNGILPFGGNAAPLTWWRDSWTPENHSTTKPIMDYYYGPNGASTRATSTFWLENTSYTRLKNITISYSLPASIIKKYNIQNVKIFLTGENLFTFTKFEFGDPETGGSISYPMLRSLSCGLNLQF